MIDEVHAYVTKQKILKEYNDLILSGRPRGISVISISTRPAIITKQCINKCKTCIHFSIKH